MPAFHIAAAAALVAVPTATPNALTDRIAALDHELFEAYNRCDLDAFGGFFDPAVSFYHDTGGATFDSATVVANTKTYICGKVHRELLPATLRIYPIKDYGGIEEGEHRFCELASGRCEGIAKFVIVWAQHGDTWRIVSVLSYGHRAITEAERRAMTQGQ